jgi:SAM-dependent methyltransferase
MTARRAGAYDAGFYADQVEGSARAAEIVLPILFGIFQPASVIDVGCGQGAWLAAAQSLGATALTGLDGDWVDRNALRGGAIDFRPTDLAGEITIEGRHDLCISVEVAEHLPAARADAFVAALCRASGVVLFSAAVPHQGGTEHVNEERASRWAARFDAQGYACFDLVRGAIWNDERVAWWYRQNLLVFVARTSPHYAAFAEAPLPASPRDLVHPQGFEQKLAYLEDERRRLRAWIERPSIAQALRGVWRALTRSRAG